MTGPHSLVESVLRADLPPPLTPEARAAIRLRLRAWIDAERVTEDRRQPDRTRSPRAHPAVPVECQLAGRAGSGSPTG